jgi:hypothetical protein
VAVERGEVETRTGLVGDWDELAACDVEGLYGGPP